MAHPRPAPWRWGRAFRAALSIGGAFALGVMLNDIMTGMWIGMGALMCCTAEGPGDYRSNFRLMLIATPLGAAGFLAGYLGALPWAGVVLAMTALAFVSSLVSSRGLPLSIGMLQALLMASIAIGVPQIAPFWKPVALYLAGALWYAALLAVEALLQRDRWRRETTAGLLDAMAALAWARSAGLDVDDARRRDVTTRMAAAWRELLANRGHGAQASHGAAAATAHLRQMDALFAATLACADSASLAAAAMRLENLAKDARAGGGATPPADLPGEVITDERLARAVAGLGASAPAGAPGAGAPPASPVAPTETAKGFSADALMSAAALALCIGAAYATHWINDASHWFWTPLTVGLVMKPDLGSVFVRAILRCAGTSLGVIIGAIILYVVPKGMGTALAIGVLAGVLPWAMARSYTLQAVFLTPLVLLLVDIIIPGSSSIDYGAQRLIDTVIGGVIVLVLGYFIWPRSKARQLDAAFATARSLLADYMRALTPPTGEAPAPGTVSRRRGETYAALSDMRNNLQKALVEPPPAGREAAAWLPLIASAERICDAITAFPPPGALTPEDTSSLRAAAQRLAGGPGAAERTETPASPAVAALVRAIDDELDHIDRISEPAGA